MSNVSVIIPTKNREHLLRITLENILGQTLKPHEIIVVDDGSVDGTQRMVETEFAGRVKFIKNRGRGPGAARNTGFDISSGSFIQFFDSDDLMTSNKLEVQAALLNSHPDVELVYGPYVMVEHSSNDWKQLDVIMQYAPLPKRPLQLLVAEGWCAITQSCMFRRSVIERAGPWREDLMPHEDKEYWYRLGKTIKSSLHENFTCVFYRQHRQQITDLDVKVMERTKDGLKAFDLIVQQLKADKVSWYSLMLCLGIRAGYKKYLREHYQSDVTYTFLDRVYFNIYRVKQKLGRLSTRTNWQPIHGPLSSPQKFQDYKNAIWGPSSLVTK